MASAAVKAPRPRRHRRGALATGLCGLAAATALVLAGASFVASSRRAPLRSRCHSGRTSLLATATQQGSSEAECPVTGRPASKLADDAQKLLQEISEVVLSTGFETGFARTAAGARAVALTAADVAREPPSALDEAFVAKVLRKLFERLGATYVKLGQFIASSPTVFPADYVREFQQCLDSTTTIPFETVKKIIEDDLGRPASCVYSFLDPKPLASASIAQVHAATLLTGEDVVVKIQKPGIEEVLKTDLGFIYLGSRILEFINPELNSRGSLADIASDLRVSMLGELDFRQEQDNLNVFREFLTANGLDKVATAPLPYPEASSKRVLTMERLHGVPLVDLEGIKKYSAEPEATLVAALNVWALSVQSCEFFHADVHAGNLLVLEDGRVGFIDFGIVGRLPPKMSKAIDDLNDALADNNARGMANALISMGATVDEVDEEQFAADIEKLLERLSSATAQAADGTSTVDESQIQDLVLDIAQVAGNNGLKLPREFGLLIKQALYFDRYTKLLAPDLDMASDPRIARLGGAAPTDESSGTPSAAEVVDVEASSSSPS